MKPFDIIITPIFIFIVYLVGYLIRKQLTDKVIRRYFIPALTVKVVGAICLGLIYHYYYGFGDTLRYHYYSQFISEMFWQNPYDGMRMLFVDIENVPPDLVMPFRQNMFVWNGDSGSMMVVRISAIFGILAYHAYYPTAVCFAILSFTGAWLLFKSFYALFPQLHKQFAYAILFVPSVFFWGSGILKDSITLAALGWLFYAILTFGKKKVRNGIIIAVSATLIALIKLYILLCFLIGIFVWMYVAFNSKIKHKMVRLLIQPLFIVVVGAAAYGALLKLAEANERFSIDNLSESAEVIASEQTAISTEGSGYTLGSDPLDFSLQGALTKLPLAINVSFFRPYIWEVRNPVMVMAALESSVILIYFLFTLRKNGLFSLFKVGQFTIIAFCVAFSLSFAAAVGMTAYNFGTLVRYKIPCIPYFLAALILINENGRAERIIKKKKKPAFEVA